jgi:hypothetical protein
MSAASDKREQLKGRIELIFSLRNYNKGAVWSTVFLDPENL